jgi:DNA-binding transcriptional ArsR family regulator
MTPARSRPALPIDDAAPLFAALGDPTRLRIIEHLRRHGPQSIARLTAGTPLTRQAVTKHLDALESVRLVHSARSGRERLWGLQPRRLERLNRYLTEISAQWDTAIGRLQRLVESDDP